jgi:metal-responsive CopG/Arc/MetJ family transcriptional regulator
MQLTVRIGDEYESLLNRLAKESGLKRSDIVRQALKHFFEEHENTPSARPFGRVSHLLGLVESGVKDLGANHREYLIR